MTNTRLPSAPFMFHAEASSPVYENPSFAYNWRDSGAPFVENVLFVYWHSLLKVYTAFTFLGVAWSGRKLK